ncbi:tetratricopeptide repeat protein [Thalassospira xianhensis]|uniref:Tetratricopeptide repeat protein n=1 Tax=Thalassospira xianhensis MCCC 1A02616 TaxID=1177929 RepID=A0A367UHR0_9PROT|nr:tetratricopeptide repeat protein [Thalassospira xianhensis]RCK07173.1 hypothetical protein TH5_04340 [Thalassospira xianhensis MCCC 1A02616]
MSFISRLFKSMYIARKISNSWEDMAKGNVDRANKEIDKAFKVYKNPLPDDLAFGGYVRYRAKRFKDAVDLYEKALISIEKSTKLNQDTKNYLKIYIRKPMAVSLAMTQEKSELFDNIAKEEMTINLKNVSDRIKSIHSMKDLEKDSTVNLIGS